MDDETTRLRDRIAHQGEEALGKFAQDLLANPLVNSALARAFEARERAAQAQEAALGALKIPSAGDIERLTRRVRSVSQRLEGIEDSLDRIESSRGPNSVDKRLADIDSQLTKLTRDIAAVAGQVDAVPAPMPREQQRLSVDAPSPPKKPKPRKKTTRKKSQ